MFDLIDKVALVTGGANGVGAAIVREFLKEGVKNEGMAQVRIEQINNMETAFVSILDIEEKSGNTLEKELAINHGNKVRFFKCDVTKDEQLFAAFKKTTEENGGLDIVVNNAGIANDGLDMFKKEIEINLTALVTSTLKALELMREDKGGKGGTIINVSSVSALALLSPTAFIYGATKAAVLHFTSSIGKEAYYSKTKVRTICTCLGATDTDLITGVRSFDEDLTQKMKTIVKYDPLQTADEAARGVVEAYKQGSSGSTFLIWCKVEDITHRVNKGYEIMAGDIFD